MDKEMCRGDTMIISIDAYSFLFEAGKLCGCVEVFEAITKKQETS